MNTHQSSLDAVIVGAGFSGLYMLYRLRGLGMKARVYEAGGDVGGAWYWNRYPGARCDVESVLYSFSFSPDLEQAWEWGERFATQPEILRYLSHVADRFDLRRDISFDSRVVSASYDADRNLWAVEIERGACILTRFLITAVGGLSACNIPQIRGLRTFKGRCMHTGNWLHSIHFHEQRVGIIGTGSSGVQLIPQVAQEARHLTVFQRTPSYSFPVPTMQVDRVRLLSAKRHYPALRELSRRGFFTGAGDLWLTKAHRKPLASRPSDLSDHELTVGLEERWRLGGAIPLLAFPSCLTRSESNKAVADFVRSKIRATVHNKALAEKMCPQYPLGSKRICLDTGYFSTFNRTNVSLVGLDEYPILEITPTGVLLASGLLIELDSLILATGFDAITGALLRLNIVGKRGADLANHWASGPLTYLGLAVAGFPNMFTITGPLSPSALGIVVLTIEQHVDWIASCLTYMRKHGFDYAEVDPEAEKRWGEHVFKIAEDSIFTKTESWYNGANISGKPRSILAFTGSVQEYREICERVGRNSYSGFVLKTSR